ncbi:MAG: transglycosylase domain-containing protein [Spirochaetaceae bacterium]|nr:transglycosylase domain-containing protein [Spirochaetaceae bacterium]
MLKITLRIAVVVMGVFALAWLILRFSPYPELEAFMARPNSVRYLDRNGILLQVTPLADGLRREIPEHIPGQVKEVFIFAEDRRFYRHFGVDALAFSRALFQNLTQRMVVSGASTITMQLARLISIEATPANTSRRGGELRRKIGEAVNAMRLETRLSKDEILELYLNSVPFGFNTEGVASASRTFFASELSMLSPAQIFCLAVIPRRPSLYNPLENPGACVSAAAELHANFSRSKRRSSAWPLLADITIYDWKFAASSARRFAYPFELPHLIRHINAGQSEPRSEIYLSIDLGLQHFLEGAVAGSVIRHQTARLTNGAAIVIDNETGEILAWVGSYDFNNEEAAGQVDGVLALNQPGSSMKPLLYAMALEKGFKPNDVIADIQMSFGVSEVYLPRNFNNRFNGPMLFRTSLASSLNIPAVYLLYRLGVRNFTYQLFSLGFDSLERSADEVGLGLALGNAPVSLKELVRSFSVFPRDGVYIPLTWELNGRTQQNSIIEQRIFSADTSRLICSILSDPDARVLAFGPATSFRTPFPSIFKTGTANQFQSIVALGATTKYSVGVWMGNFTGETVIGRTGSSVPAATVRDTLVFLHGRGSAQEFPTPENWQPQRICALSGMMPTHVCPATINEYIQTGEENRPCTWHQMVDGRFEVVFPAEYQAWFNTAVRQGSIDFSSRPLEITNPRDGFVYLSSSGIGRNEIPVEVIGGTEDELHVTFNGRSFSITRPFVFFLERSPGFHTLHVQSGYEERVVTFTVQP